MSRIKKARTTHWARPVAGAVVFGLLSANTQVATAQPLPPSNADIRYAEDAAATAQEYLQSLISTVTSNERQVAELELAMGSVREDVNKAMVDLESARDVARSARVAVDQARSQLDRSRKELARAQKAFDEITRTIMRQGYSHSSIFEGARSISEAINRQSQIRREAERQRSTVAELDQTRTQAANQESSLRAKQEEATKAEAAATQRHADAEAAYEQANAKLQAQQAEYERARVERDAAKAALDAARATVQELNEQRNAYDNEQARKAAEAEAAKKAAQAAADRSRAQSQQQGGTTDSVSSGGNSTTSAAPSTTAAPASSTTATTTVTSAPTTTVTSAPTTTASQPAQSSSGSTSQGTPAQTLTPPNPETGQSANASSSQKVEIVIARAMSQLGVPYAWGGGNANGPTRGIRDGGVADAHGDYNKIGFDCSGLTLYAYAGVGINLPHYTGYQYQRGKHYPVSQMKRGDLLFWGPNGHGHVAIYLGDGKMIEAPQSGSTVKISPVRYNGMTPNVVRLV